MFREMGRPARERTDASAADCVGDLSVGVKRPVISDLWPNDQRAGVA